MFRRGEVKVRVLLKHRQLLLHLGNRCSGVLGNFTVVFLDLENTKIESSRRSVAILIDSKQDTVALLFAVTAPCAGLRAHPEVQRLSIPQTAGNFQREKLTAVDGQGQ
jgi:hypothetical protein